MIGGEFVTKPETYVLVRLRQYQHAPRGGWVGIVVLSGEGFITTQETLRYKELDKVVDELKKGVRLFHPDFESDILSGIEDAHKDALKQMAIER